MAESAHVLVVEDDPKMAQFIAFKLNYLGYRVAGMATSETSAIELANQVKPDVILMDIMLKDGDDGIVTANKILASQDIPIVYLTAHEDDELFQRAKITKPFGYIIKPFNDRDLTLVLEIVTYRREQQEKLSKALDDARSIINSSFVMVMTTNKEGRIIEFNDTAEWELGYGREEVAGRNICELMADPNVLNVVREKLPSVKRFEVEVKFRKKTGDVLESVLSVSTLKDSKGTAKGVLFMSN